MVRHTADPQKWKKITVMVFKLLKEVVTGKLFQINMVQDQFVVLSVRPEIRNSVKEIC